MKQAGTGEITTRERYFFAAADIWGGGGQTIISVLYLVFLTNVLGVRPGLAGTALMLVKLWDGIIDPFIGVITDNTRTRWGRRRPYLMFGSAALLFVMALLWLPVRFAAEGAQVAFIILTNILYATVASVLGISYSSMSTEITTDFQKRNQVNMTRLVFSLVSTAVCTLLPTAIFDQVISGGLGVWAFYAIIVGGFGLVFTLPILLAGLICRERVPHSGEKARLDFSALLQSLRLKAFRKLIMLYLCQTLTMDTISAVVIYYGMYVVPGMSSTVFLGAFMAMQLLMFPILNRQVNRVSKTKLFRMGLPLSILGAAGIAFYPSGGPPMGIYLLAGLTALGFAGALTLSWVIYPDVVDIGELAFGRRHSGSFSAVMTFIRQVSSAFTMFVVGNALQLSGFVTPVEGAGVPIQPPATILVLRLIILLTFVLLAGGGYFVARGFRLTPQVSARVKYFLDKRRAGQGGSLTGVEQTELDQLLKEFS